MTTQNCFRALILGTSLAAGNALLPTAAEAQTTPVSIMPLGDSITYGYPYDNGGGYRDQLYKSLTADNFAVTYLGSSNGNPSPTLIAANQTAHEGHSGYRIDQIQNNLDGSDPSTSNNNGGFWLNAAVNPQYILLHIGSNDIDTHYNPNNQATEAGFLSDLESRLHSLVAQIFSDKPGVKLLIAAIVPVNDSSDKLSESQAYNSYIQNTLVPEFAADGAYFVDQYSNFYQNGAVRTDLMQDDRVHPTQTGYDRMGQTWANAIEATPEPGSLMLLSGLVTGAGLIRTRRMR